MYLYTYITLYSQASSSILTASAASPPTKLGKRASSYIYIYKYIYTHIYIHVYIYIYIYMYTYTSISLYLVVVVNPDGFCGLSTTAHKARKKSLQLIPRERPRLLFIYTYIYTHTHIHIYLFVVVNPNGFCRVATDKAREESLQLIPRECARLLRRFGRPPGASAQRASACQEG